MQIVLFNQRLFHKNYVPGIIFFMKISIKGINFPFFLGNAVNFNRNKVTCNFESYINYSSINISKFKI